MNRLLNTYIQLRFQRIPNHQIIDNILVSCDGRGATIVPKTARYGISHRNGLLLDRTERDRTGTLGFGQPVSKLERA